MAIYICNQCGEEHFRYEPFVVCDKDGRIFCEPDCAFQYHCNSDSQYNEIIDNVSLGYDLFGIKEINWDEPIFDEQDCEKYAGIQVFKI